MKYLDFLRGHGNKFKNHQFKSIVIGNKVRYISIIHNNLTLNKNARYSEIYGCDCFDNTTLYDLQRNLFIRINPEEESNKNYYDNTNTITINTNDVNDVSIGKIIDNSKRIVQFDENNNLMVYEFTKSIATNTCFELYHTVLYMIINNDNDKINTIYEMINKK
jgi:hypothetical protein